MPFSTLFIRLNFEPIIIAVFIGFNICDKGLELLFESVFPFLIFGASMDCEKRNFIGCLFDRGHHFAV